MFAFPTNAENVASGASSWPTSFPCQEGAGCDATWELNCHRRIIGTFFWQANWQIRSQRRRTNMLVHAIQAVEANLQRGFLTGELRDDFRFAPTNFQPRCRRRVAKHSRPLRQDIEGAAAIFYLQVGEPGYQLALGLERTKATNTFYRASQQRHSFLCDLR